MPIVDAPDVFVLGGGPAGCAAARLLALWGHRVTLATRPRSNAPHYAESIPPSTRKLFDVLGVTAAVDAAGFVRATGNTVWWGRGEPRIERFAAGERGWQVRTDELESILQTAARQAGVEIAHTRVDCESALGTTATFTLDCTGRAGVLARARGWRVHDDHHRTVALAGVWRTGSACVLPDDTHTLIESYRDGWAWSVPDRDGLRHVAVMVDPRTSALARGGRARDVYEAEIRKTDRFKALLSDAVLVDGPHGWDASMYSATQYADERVLLVGDAASFLDPLSSAGVKKALASGWLAAVATHTALVRPAMRSVALAFFAARECEVYVTFRTMTERFLADAARGYARPFWEERTDAQDANESESVGAAFERIRRARSLHLELAPGTTIEQKPAVSGTEIVLEPRLVSAQNAVGARFVFDVDLVALAPLLSRHTQVPDLFEAYNRITAPVALPDFLAALAVGVARGWLSLQEGATVP